MNKIKLILTTILFLLLTGPTFADVMPYYTGALSKETIGFAQIPNSINIYQYPRNDSLVLEKLTWDKDNVKLNKYNLDPSETFAVLLTSKAISLCMVIDDAEDGWYKIIYDKTNNKSGWIKINEESFWGLRDFYSFYGRKYGLYYMKNVDYRKRGLYSGADELSQKIGSFTLIKSIKLNKISGNWALVTIIDFDKSLKIGYVQWREKDGLLMMFPKLSQ